MLHFASLPLFVWMSAVVKRFNTPVCLTASDKIATAFFALGIAILVAFAALLGVSLFICLWLRRMEKSRELDSSSGDTPLTYETPPFRVSSLSP